MGTVILIKEDNFPLLQWKLTIVDETFPVSDGLVRVVTLRNKQEVFKKPISKLCELPVTDNDIEQFNKTLS